METVPGSDDDIDRKLKCADRDRWIRVQHSHFSGLLLTCTFEHTPHLEET
jgi:hypothetical protein